MDSVLFFTVSTLDTTAILCTKLSYSANLFQIVYEPLKMSSSIDLWYKNQQFFPKMMDKDQPNLTQSWSVLQLKQHQVLLIGKIQVKFGWVNLHGIWLHLVFLYFCFSWYMRECMMPGKGWDARNKTLVSQQKINCMWASLDPPLSRAFA